MELKGLGQILVITGVLLLSFGVLILLFPHLVEKLGHLPGDLRWERPGLKIYIPITTMLLLSLLLTLILNLIFRGKG